MRWESEEFAEEQAELEAFADAIMEQIHGEHPLEDEIDRAMGIYPGTDIEIPEPATIRVPVIRLR